ncbi:Ig-like domain-containing protein [Nannocystis punicea]|uniref:Ig-like domain-containing protein n=1 Tax=Nannocystis punicea TaxID=2995304 RepID=A0ABY7H2H9_9BACT|nr:Ig-like domain-containing protein [Nannocystis poenicansa]WAS93347.1 Ig-like domain-containing protein [Nannocystis poenicansa]
MVLLTACTVYQVPNESETDTTVATGDATGMTTTGTPTGTTTDEPDPTTSSTSSTGTGPDPSAGPSSDPTVSSDPTTEEPPPADCDYPTSIQPIFDQRCSCHQSMMPPKGLALNEGTSFAALVGVDSMGQPGTPYVDPGNSAGSWLVTKIKPMPPVGLQMPEGGMLDADQVALIETWIDAGAPEAGAFDCGGGSSGEAGSVTIDEQGPVNVEIGEMLDLDVTVLDEFGDPVMGATVKWLSSDETVLYVDAKGTLLGLNPGTSEVTAEVEGAVSSPLTVSVLNNQAVAAATFTDALNTLSTNCGCHKGAMPPAGLAFDLAAPDVHAALLAPATQDAQTKRVIPDLPGQSYLFKKLTRTTQTTGEQMPKGKAPLEAEKVQILFRWIFNGAPA